MAADRIRDIADRIRSGTVVYVSSADEDDAWQPAGVVLRLDTGEWGSEARLFVITPDRTLTSLGQLAEDEGAELAEVISRYDISSAPDALAPLELEHRIDAVPAAWTPLPDMDYTGDIRVFTMIGSCTVCAPHNPHLPNRCRKCSAPSECNW
jgi:hypothetical protein